MFASLLVEPNMNLSKTHNVCSRRQYIVKLILKQLTRKGVPELRSPALVCLSALDKKWPDINFVNISVLVFLMGQNHKCPGHNY